VLAIKLYLPLGAGGVIFGVAAGVAIVRSSQLPSWLGWASMAVGILTVAAGLLGLLLFVIWAALALASILLFRRNPLLQAPEAATSEPAAV
jgi:hypothetical protein